MKDFLKRFWTEYKNPDNYKLSLSTRLRLMRMFIALSFIIGTDFINISGVMNFICGFIAFFIGFTSIDIYRNYKQ